MGAPVQPFMTKSAFFPADQNTQENQSVRTNVQAELESPHDQMNGPPMFGQGVKKVKKIKKVKKKPSIGQDIDAPYQLPANDHDLVNKVLQPQDEQSIPDLDFDPNDPGNEKSNANDGSLRPSGMSKQDSDAINGDVELDDDFDYDDIDIQDNASPRSR